MENNILSIHYKYIFLQLYCNENNCIDIFRINFFIFISSICTQVFFTYENSNNLANGR